MGRPMGQPRRAKYPLGQLMAIPRHGIHLIGYPMRLPTVQSMRPPWDYMIHIIFPWDGLWDDPCDDTLHMARPMG